MAALSLVLIIVAVMLTMNVLWTRSLLCWSVRKLFKIKQKKKTTKPQPKKPPFRVAKFCRELWQSVHKEDKQILKQERLAMANFRLGAISALKALEVDRNKIDEVVERIEINRFR